MSTRESGPRRHLGPLHEFFDSPDVREIHVNDDGTVHLETSDGRRSPAIVLTHDQRSAFLERAADASGQEFTDTQPILHCELPDDLGRARLAAVRPPVSRAPALTIRKHIARIIPLSEYVDRDVLTARDAETLRDLLRRRRNLLIAGGTDTGKPPLANALLGELSEIEPDTRLLVLEDTAELKSALANALFLRTAPSATLEDLLRATLRLHPDRIVVGEVRGTEAYTLLDALMTGHPGGLATVHAETPSGALLRLAELASRNRSGRYEALAAAAIHAVVVMERDRGTLRLRDLVSVDPQLDAGGRFQLLSLR